MNEQPPNSKPEPFPDWRVVGQVLSALLVVTMIGVVVATMLGLLETPAERRRRVRFEAYEREQDERLRRSNQEAEETKRKLKIIEREIFGDRK